MLNVFYKNKNVCCRKSIKNFKKKHIAYSSKVTSVSVLMGWHFARNACSILIAIVHHKTIINKWKHFPITYTLVFYI